MRAFCLLGLLLGACGPSVSASGDAGVHAGDHCTGDVQKCDGNTLYACDQSTGTYQVSQMCASACDPTLGCVMCVPNTGTCTGSMSHACNPDGSGYSDTYCDPIEGMTCDFGSGACTGVCAPQSLGRSYIGCEYYPTVTGNEVSNHFDYAVAISNTSAVTANVQIDSGALAVPAMIQVPANQLVVYNLPWVAGLKGGTCNGECGGAQTHGGKFSKGAYHLRSDQPVTVYQFNPLEYVIQYNGAPEYSVTNDASLLLPTNVLGQHYYAASWYPLNNSASYPSEIVVTAVQDNTIVTLSTKQTTIAGTGTPVWTANTPQAIMLNAGDALEVMTGAGDLTGSSIQSDKPVQVISGAFCVYIPTTVMACDHIEESMFPVETLSTKYVVNAPEVPGIPNGKVEVVRIMATESDTTVSYDPPQGSAGTHLANAGDFIELSGNAASFLVTADKKIQVAQYMEGEEAGGSTGDPSLSLAVAVDQYRDSYLFHAPTNYDTNFVDVTAPMSGHVLVDGAQVPALTAIGTSGYGVARVALSKATGTHMATGDAKFGIQVYGYGQYTSYWYPGGLDLQVITIGKTRAGAGAPAAGPRK